MKKLIAYKMSLNEAESLLQDVLDNADLRLVRYHDCNFCDDFYYAESDTQFLDGYEIDERFAQVLGVKTVQHYAIGNKELLAVVTAQ